MKIASVNSYTQSNINNKKNNPNFKGLTQTLVDFWQFIDNGGRAAQFTVEDMLGTNFPRSIKGVTAGYKYKKNDPNYPTVWSRLNINALKQEGIREFLTGPTMCLTPVAILLLSKHILGDSANTHIENIKNLTYLLSKTEIQEGKDIADSFYETVIKDMLNKTTGQDVASESVDKMVSLIKELDALKNSEKEKTVFEKLKNWKNFKGDQKDIQAKMQELFENVVKNQKTDYKGTDFLTASYSINGSKKGATAFKNYIDYASAYIKDFKKSGISLDEISKFKSSWIGKRALVVSGMIFLTGILMSQIPKIYTKASGKVNPNASTIYDEARKQNGEVVVNSTVSENTNNKEEKSLKSALLIAAGAAAILGAGFALIKGKQKPEFVDIALNKLNDISQNVKKLAEKNFEKIGKSIGSSAKMDKLLKYIEPTGANNPFLVLVGLMTGTVIVPRVITAAKRNPDNKEATMDEIKEILFRDIQSVLVILFALKSLNSLVSGAATKFTGIPMTTKPYKPLFDKSVKGIGNKIKDVINNPLKKLKIIGKNFLDTLHPTAGVRARTNEEFQRKYSNYKFEDLSKLYKEITSDRGDVEKVHNFIIDGTIKECEEILNGTKKGFSGIINQIRLTLNKEGKQALNDTEKMENLKKTIEDLKALKAKGSQAIFEEQGKNVQEAIEAYLSNADNSLVNKGKGINAWLRTIALGIEVSYLGFGLPALNQRRLEKKYLKNHKDDAVSQNNNRSETSLIGKNIKAHQIKLYHDFIK